MIFRLDCLMDHNLRLINDRMKKLFLHQDQIRIFYATKELRNLRLIILDLTWLGFSRDVLQIFILVDIKLGQVQNGWSKPSKLKDPKHDN